MNTANGVLHKLCVGAEFAEGRTFSPSCSCGWRGVPDESERTAWETAVMHAVSVNRIYGTQRAPQNYREWTSDMCLCGHSAKAHGDGKGMCLAGDDGPYGVQPCTCHEFRMAPGQGQEPTGSKAGSESPAPEVGAPTGAAEFCASADDETRIQELMRIATSCRSNREYAQKWRDDAFEVAAQIAERYGATSCAGDIRAHVRTSPTFAVENRTPMLAEIIDYLDMVNQQSRGLDPDEVRVLLSHLHTALYFEG